MLGPNPGEENQQPAQWMLGSIPARIELDTSKLGSLMTETVVKASGAARGAFIEFGVNLKSSWQELNTLYPGLQNYLVGDDAPEIVVFPDSSIDKALDPLVVATLNFRPTAPLYRRLRRLPSRRGRRADDKTDVAHRRPLLNARPATTRRDVPARRVIARPRGRDGQR